MVYSRRIVGAGVRGGECRAAHRLVTILNVSEREHLAMQAAGLGSVLSDDAAVLRKER